ncbi:MAG: hypothetical protein AAF668_16910 [Pseudomonadota bacterium]
MSRPESRSVSKTILAYSAGYVGAVATAFVLGSVFQTQMLLNGITDLGFEVPLSTRLHTTIRDIWGMGIGGSVGFFSGYLGLILPAFAIALPTARLLMASRSFLKRIPGFAGVQPLLERVAYPAACVVAIWTIHYSLKTEYPAGTFFAGARGTLGMGLQLLAGALAGGVFAAFTPKR